MKIPLKERFKQKESTINLRVWSWLTEGIERKAKAEGISSANWIREQLIKGLEK